MKTILRVGIIAMVSSAWLHAEAVTLLRAAELTTNYLKTEKIDGRTLNDFFVVVALRRLNADAGESKDRVVWRVDLEETELKRDDPRMNVAITEDGKKYRRVLEVTDGEAVRFGKMPDFPRPVVFGTRIFPQPDKK